MRLIRPRFTLRWSIIAVAILAVVLALEKRMFWLCAKLVSDLGDGEDYLLGEAWTVWSIFHLPILLLCLVLGRAKLSPCRQNDALTLPPKTEDQAGLTS
jgi:hypothetical protein